MDRADTAAKSKEIHIYGENGYQNGTTLPYYAVAIVPGPGSNNAQQSTFTEELQLQGRTGDGRLSYQAGAYFERSRPVDGFQTALTPNGLACTDIVNLQCTDVTRRGNLSLSRSKYYFRNLGVYAQGTYKITDTISLTGGIRYTSDRTSGLGEPLRLIFTTPNVPTYTCSQPVPLVQGGTSAEIIADPTRCDFRRKVSSSKPTWLIDVDWKPVDDVLIYAKYARGYRQGSVNVSSYGLETWGPEKVDLYEVGAKTSFDGFVRGTFNVAAYYNDFLKQQIAINTISCLNIPSSPACAGIPTSQFPAPAQGVVAGGKSTIKGIEEDASVYLLEGLRLDVGYSYLDTKLKSITIPPVQRGFVLFQPNAVVGGPLSLSPKNKYTITGSYTLPLAKSVGEVILSATFSHQDRQFGNASSIVAPGRSSRDSNSEILPPHLLNLNLNWNSVAGSTVDLALFVTNVTKNKFQTYTTGSSFGWDAYLLNEPRMFGVRARYSFGS